MNVNVGVAAMGKVNGHDGWDWRVSEEGDGDGDGDRLVLGSRPLVLETLTFPLDQDSSTSLPFLSEHTAVQLARVCVRASLL